MVFGFPTKYSIERMNWVQIVENLAAVVTLQVVCACFRLDKTGIRVHKVVVKIK